MVSDGSDFHREPRAPSVLTELLTSAVLLRSGAGVPATALLLSAATTEELTQQLRGLNDDYAGVYLMHTDDPRARATQVMLHGSLPVITQRQCTAVALTAAALSTFARSGTPLSAGRIVILDPERNPLVGACAVAAGVGEIDGWVPDDAQDFRLSALARGATCVIDLLGCTADHDGTLPVTPSVLTTADPVLPLLALPGLIAATASGRSPGLGLFLASAYALAARTPPGQILPELTDPGIASALSEKSIRTGA